MAHRAPARTRTAALVTSLGAAVVPALLAAATTFLMAAPAAGQDTLQVARGRSCQACRVTMEPVVSLGADASVHGPRLESRVARDGRGRYFVGPTYTPGTVAVYGPDGRFVEAFGKQGSGPGEFSTVRFVVAGPGDSIWVVSGPGRISVVSPELEVVREVSVGGGIDDLVPLPDGGAVARIGQGFLVSVAPDGTVGERVALPEQDAMGSPFENALVPLPGGALVAPQGTRYRLDVVRADGAHERVVVRATTWFPELVSDEDMSRMEQGGQVVGAIGDAAMGQDGPLWVLVYLVNLGRMPELEEEMRQRGASMPSIAMLLEVVDPVVEAFDLEAGSVVATGGAKERFYTSFMDSDHIVGIRELDDGNVVLDVWRLGVRGR